MIRRACAASIFALFCAACGPAAPVSASPVSSAPKPTVAPAAVAIRAAAIHGHLLRHDGKQAPTLAHATLSSLTDVKLHELDVNATGNFELPLAGVTEEVVRLDIAAVDHKSETLFIALSEAPLELTIQLGTYALTSSLEDVKVVIDGTKVPVPVTKRANGKYAADLTLKDGRYTYHLDGSAMNRGVNGTTSEGYEYDSDGDYASVLNVTGGKALVEVDPAKRPPSNVPSRVTFAGENAAASRAMTEIARSQAAMLDSMNVGMHEVMAKKGDMGAFFETTQRATRDLLLNAAKGEQRPLVIHFAQVKAMGLGEMPAPTPEEQKVAAALLETLPPANAMWGLAARAFAVSVRTAGGDRAALTRTFIDTQPSEEAVAEELLAELREAKGDLTRSREIFARLKTPRFARIPAVMFSALDPDRVNAPGKQVPTFAVKKLNATGLDAKKTMTPGTFHGDVFLVDLWASWCAPCMAEMPAMHALYAKYGQKKGKKLRILSISMDDKPEDALKVRKTFRMPWEHGFAGNDEQQREVRNAFGTRGIPFYMLVDATGKIVQSSPLHIDDLGPVLDKLLP